jgi:DNA polymerase
MIITGDWETYYDNDYSLSRMSETDYILSPLFQPHMLALKLGDGPVITYVGDEAIRAAVTAIDWSQVAFLSHNARFDGSILAWRYGCYPKLYLDTFSMARALTHAQMGSSSLKAVANYFGMAPKGDYVVNAKGKRIEHFLEGDPAELALYVSYCEHDTQLCYDIFNQFRLAGFPNSELQVIDIMLRMFIQPQAKLNPFALAEHLHMVQQEKQRLLANVEAMAHGKQLSSNPQFAQLLEGLGVDVPRKISPTTGKETWALAKNDRGFRELLNDPDQPSTVQALLAARVGVKSTIEETRALTLLNLSRQDWSVVGIPPDPWMPVPYRYYGAHTGRPSGDGGYNFTNLKRGSPLRGAITAPEGCRVVHRDSSQIEARLVAWLAGCSSLVHAFAEGRDVYSEFATRFYGVPVTKADVPRRFAGKTAILSLGYGCGAPKFRNALYIGAGGVSLDLRPEIAEELVGFYRSSYPEIPLLWRRGEGALHRMIRRLGGTVSMHVSQISNLPALPVVVEGDGFFTLPNGLYIQYPKLRREYDPTTGSDQTVYTSAKGGDIKIYGAKVIENVTQGLARIVITDIMVRVFNQTGYHPALTTYDSLDYVVPETDVDAFNTILETEFALCPEWAPGLPLASEGGYGKSLLDAEKALNT